MRNYSKRYLKNAVGISPKTLASTLLIIGGLCFIVMQASVPTVYPDPIEVKRFVQVEQDIAYEPLSEKEIIGNRIISEAIGLDVPLLPAYRNPATLELSIRDGVAESIQELGFDYRRGTGYIYGHDRHDAFSVIDRLKPGQTVLIVASSGRTYEYTMISSEIVEEDAVYKINEAKDEQKLVLQTCTGFRSKQRLLVSLILTDVRV